MKSYHNDSVVKTKFTDRIKQHQEADNLVQGYGYWDDGKGCAVGCTLEVNTEAHAQYPIQLGLPEWLAHLEDHLFENLPVEEARKWPMEFLDAIPVGIEVEKFDAVRDRFQIFWLERQKTQIEQSKYPSVVDAINTVIQLLTEALGGNEPVSAAWSAAESAAWSAAWSAAESAAWSAAVSAAESAARSAAVSAAWSAKYSEAIVKRDWLLAELKSLK